MRTQTEIVERLESRRAQDVFGFEVSEYVRALDFEHARPYLKEGVTAEEWEPDLMTDDAIRKCAVDYMDFAWEKANGCRGISAWRSLAHYQAWLWLLGDDELWPTLSDYEYYGKPELRRICEYFGLDADHWDDGVRTNEG